MIGKQTERNKAGKILNCTAGKTYPCGKSCFSIERLCFKKGGYQARKKALQLAEYLKSTFLDEPNEEQNNKENDNNTESDNNKEKDSYIKYKEDIAVLVDFNSPIKDNNNINNESIKQSKESFDSIFNELRSINDNLKNIQSIEEYNDYYNQVKSVYSKIASIREELKKIDVTTITNEDEFKIITFINNIPNLPLPGYKITNVDINKIKEIIGDDPCQ